MQATNEEGWAAEEGLAVVPQVQATRGAAATTVVMLSDLGSGIHGEQQVGVLINQGSILSFARNGECGAFRLGNATLPVS
ncbi:unnamed protein product [Ilex paraguariensis]|uniref:Uncharacterized protein n=1 Tax=Ilex paraguariensis TaxID=185542 RepID=A0ABC8RI62_9AQUA